MGFATLEVYMTKHKNGLRLRIVNPEGPELIRLYHRSIVDAHLNAATPEIEVMPIRTRAKLITRATREIVARETTTHKE